MISKYPILALLLGGVLLSTPFLANAQTDSVVPHVASDTAVIRVVMQGVYGKLGWALAQAAHDTTRHPWDIRFPSVDSALWGVHRTNILRIVRGRVPTKADSSISTLSIGAITFRGDTLVVDFRLGTEWRCAGGRWTGNGLGYQVVTVRAWETPRVAQTMVEDGFCGTKPTT